MKTRMAFPPRRTRHPSPVKAPAARHVCTARAAFLGMYLHHSLMSKTAYDPSVFSAREPPCPCRKSTVELEVWKDESTATEWLEWTCKECQLKTSIQLL